MKKTIRIGHISALAALLGCALSANVLAQRSESERTFNSEWYIAPSINAMRPDDKFGSDHHGEGLGLRFGQVVSPNWDIQAGVSTSRQRFNGVRYQQNTAGVDALYMFSRSSFRPFVLLGVGAEYDKQNIYARNVQRDRTSPYVAAGVGFQLSLGERWGIQADVRRAHSYLRGNTFGFDRANTNTATLGLTYAFGSPARPMPVAQRAPEPVFTALAAAAVAPPPAPLAPVAPVAPPPPPPRYERYTLAATELFEFDRAVLRLPQTKLDEIAVALNNNAQLTNITVLGYTDRLGSEAYNMKLSQRRADAVKLYLTNKGVAASRLSAIAKGELNPVVVCTNKDRAALIKCLEPNRRVEVEQIVFERRLP